MAVYPYQFIKENPFQYVSTPKYDSLKKNDEDLKTINVDEFNKMVARFPFASSFYIYLQIGFNTGMRASEVFGISWDCIYLDEGKIKVEKIIIKKGIEWCFGTPKTSSSQREILIGKTLIYIFKKYQIENKLKYGKYYDSTIYNFPESNSQYSAVDLVCTKENVELVSTDSLKYLSRVVNYELGINFNFHSLRHTHATLLLESGANIKEIQTRLGHNKLGTTMDTYSHVT